MNQSSRTPSSEHSPARAAFQSPLWASGLHLPRHGIPAWLLSLGLHCTVFTVLGLMVDVRPQGGQENAEPQRNAGIVLVRRSAGDVQYFSDDPAAGGSESAVSAETPSIALPSAFPEANEAPTTSGPQLPSSSAPLVAIGPPGESVPGVTGLAQGRGRRGTGGHDYEVETGVFGVKGRGSTFVYVFDRSASMSGFEGRPLRAAKRELVASLQSLGKVHQFQVIFYNQKPHLMTFGRNDSPRLVFADDEGKLLAENFIRSVVADGGTRHVEALKLALQMRPDVIFFLTDADEPRLTNSELAQIHQLNQGTTINAVEYGAGPSFGTRTFLQQLAEDNGGQHRYVDITQLPRD